VRSLTPNLREALRRLVGWTWNVAKERGRNCELEESRGRTDVPSQGGRIVVSLNLVNEMLYRHCVVVLSPLKEVDIINYFLPLQC